MQTSKIGLICLPLFLTVAGCGNNGGNDVNSNPPNPSPPTTQTQGSVDLVSTGKGVYKTHRCSNCHAIGGQGSQRGPDLSKVGAEAEHTPEWLIAHVKNPKSHEPDSKMPAFDGKISEDDLKALGAYLASLK